MCVCVCAVWGASTAHTVAKALLAWYIVSSSGAYWDGPCPCCCAGVQCSLLEWSGWPQHCVWQDHCHSQVIYRSRWRCDKKVWSDRGRQGEWAGPCCNCMAWICIPSAVTYRHSHPVDCPMVPFYLRLPLLWRWPSCITKVGQRALALKTTSLCSKWLGTWRKYSKPLETTLLWSCAGWLVCRKHWNIAFLTYGVYCILEPT